MANPNGRSVALLLDMSPTVWTSVDEFHCRLCQALSASNILPVVVFAAEAPPAFRARFESAGAVMFTLNYWHGRFRYYRRLGEIFQQYHVELIQTRGFNYFILLWWMVRLQGVDRIIFLEGNSGLLRAGNWKRKLLRMRTLLMTLPVTRAVTVTKFVKGQLIEIGFGERKVQPIYNGVDLARFHPDDAAGRQWREQYSVRPGEIVVSTISYLRAFKNPHIILQACALLLERGLAIRLFVAGSGELLDPMKELSRKLGIANRVHWLGNFGETEKLLQASDVFVLASVGEAIGNVLLEALACGVPCVGSRSGGIPEIVDDGKTGYLATPLDATDFAAAIEKLARDSTLRNRMALECARQARERFDVDVTVGHFLDLYQTLWAK